MSHMRKLEHRLQALRSSPPVHYVETAEPPCLPPSPAGSPGLLGPVPGPVLLLGLQCEQPAELGGTVQDT